MSNIAREIAEQWMGGGPVERRSKRFRTGKLADDIQAALNKEWNKALESAREAMTPYGQSVNQDAISALTRSTEVTTDE